MRPLPPARGQRRVRSSMVLICMLAHALMSTSASAIDSHPVNATELAKQRFQEAKQAYQEERYSAAASLFEAADRLAPHASTRYNAATAWEQAGEEARAATGYEAVLALDSLDDARRATARERLQSLALRLGKVRIREPIGALVTVDHVQRAPVPLTFYLRPGRYELDVAYRGTNSQTSAAVLAGEDKELELNLPLAVLPVEPTPSVPLTPVPPAPRPTDDGTAQKTWGWVSLGAGVALSGAAIFLGVRALNARDRFVASDNTDAEARQDASDLRLASNILWGGATVAGATGLVLLLTAPTVEF
jgi:tetratricopeptide (TPR) repeat protein